MNRAPLNHRARASIRLPDYDYTQHGAYFVTICSHGRSPTFARISDGAVTLTRLGVIVREEWLETMRLRDRVALDEFVVMPNHFHAIVWLCGGGHRSASWQREGFGSPIAGSLPTVIRAFKAAVSRRYAREFPNTQAPVWQRSFYEHIIRRDSELEEIRAYISENPLRWDADSEYVADS